MAIISKQLAKARWLLTSVAVVTVLTVIVGRHYCLDRNQWPAWVQAVGSIAAILVAVWVSWQQSELQRQRDEAKERAELAGMLRSIRSEVETTLRYIAIEVAHPLRELPLGDTLERIFPLPEHPFPIFDAFIPKLGLVTDEWLQRQIIHTFALAKSFAMTLNHHNQLLEELRDERIRSRDSTEFLMTAARIERLSARLNHYTHGLRGALSDIQHELGVLHERLLTLYPET